MKEKTALLVQANIMTMRDVPELGIDLPVRYNKIGRFFVPYRPYDKEYESAKYQSRIITDTYLKKIKSDNNKRKSWPTE